MKPYELTELMHAVLDGEATPAEARNLERTLAADADARAEFDSLRALFDELKGVPQALPPEGLVASVMADLPSSQLSAPSRVIGARAQAGSPISDMARRESRSVPFSGSRLMKRKVIFVGAGVAALAVILLASSGIDFPPGGTNTTGAIVPAQRFRADQPATTGVSATGQSESAQRASQGTQGNTGDARSSDARASDSLKANGRADSLSDGRANDARANDGRSDGRADAMKDGRSDAMKDGRADAMKDGRSDAMKDGRSDNMKDGRVSQ
jgi:anti-sigma factor RsiW